MTYPSQLERRQALIDDLYQCRQGTLTLIKGLEPNLLSLQAHPDFSPVGWHLGHIAFTESLWILEHLAGQACPFPQYRKLFAADGLPKAERQNLPSLDALHAFLDDIRQRVLAYIQQSTQIEQDRLWRWLIQHESQHGETMALIMALHQTQGRAVPLKIPGVGSLRDSSISANGKGIQPRAVKGQCEANTTDPSSAVEMIYVEAGPFCMGQETPDAIDNEQPRHTVDLKAYWIDRTPVTCGQYQGFMAAGGYQNRDWWSEAGWDWLQMSQVTQPLYWRDDDPLLNHPVSGVNWHEADAYARFVGKRLPTEAEWEKAASWHPQRHVSWPYPWGVDRPTQDHCNHNHHLGHTAPVDHFSQNISPVGCQDMLGNVWEWTRSWFAGYSGFTAYPYRGYSQAYFDQAHRVLKGGSWATRPWVIRNSFRYWYHPHVRELFMGFRCAQNG